MHIEVNPKVLHYTLYTCMHLIGAFLPAIAGRHYFDRSVEEVSAVVKEWH